MDNNSQHKSNSTGKNRGGRGRIENLKPWKKGQPSPNPKGRAKGQKDYATLYREALVKLAKANGKTAEQLEIELLQSGFANARKGDYRFYKDVLDRAHGMAVQKTEITGKDGKDLVPDGVLKERIDDAITIYINGNKRNPTTE